MSLMARCSIINELFEKIIQSLNSDEKDNLIQEFKDSVNEDIQEDLAFCFDVLAGEYKLPYIYKIGNNMGTLTYKYLNYNIRDFITKILNNFSNNEEGVELASVATPPDCRVFIKKLVNREWNLYYPSANQVKKVVKRTLMGGNCWGYCWFQIRISTK